MIKSHIVASRLPPKDHSTLIAVCGKEIHRAHIFVNFEGDLRSLDVQGLTSLSDCRKCVKKWQEAPDREAIYLSECVEAELAREGE